MGLILRTTHRTQSTRLDPYEEMLLEQHKNMRRTQGGVIVGGAFMIASSFFFPQYCSNLIEKDAEVNCKGNFASLMCVVGGIIGYKIVQVSQRILARNHHANATDASDNV